MYQLKPILKQNDLVLALMYAAKNCEEIDHARQEYGRVQGLVELACNQLAINKPDLTGFTRLLRWFYRNMAFSGAKSQYFKSEFSLLNKVVDNRTGIPAMLAVLFCHIAARCGFDVSCVGFPSQFLIRWQASEFRAYFFDPSTGRCLDYEMLLSIYNRTLDGESVSQVPQELFDAALEEVTLIRVLHNLKSAYINESQYSKALKVSDMLVDLSPEDPYERRDRGFLLEQLDCPHSASRDYQYFVDHCPKDPMIQFVQAQLNKARKSHFVVH